MIYEWFSGEAVRLLDEYMASKGWPPLNPFISRVLVAKDDHGAIAGIHVLQLLPHAEPLVVEPEYRGSGVAEELAARMTDYLAEMNTPVFFVTTATNPFVKKLCESNGMKETPLVVYSKGEA